MGLGHTLWWQYKLHDPAKAVCPGDSHLTGTCAQNRRPGGPVSVRDAASMPENLGLRLTETNNTDYLTIDMRRTYPSRG